MDDKHRGEEEDQFAGLRQRMVEGQLQSRDIRDRRVLEAMSRVPRERFVPESLRDQAYVDRALAIGQGQTISQPYIVAKMLEALNCRPEDRALEIGAGSGYQAALLGELCAEVWAVEIVEELAENARALLFDLGYDNVTIIVADGTQGLPQHAPYDRIIVAAAAPHVPAPLTDQLADGGRLVIPVGGRLSQELMVIERDGDSLRQSKSLPCMFVPLIGRHGWQAPG